VVRVSAGGRSDGTLGPVTTQPRVRAAELVGRGWLNTGDRSLTLADFRGRFLLLDFWTFCCVNCLHVLDELRPLEQRLGDVLAVVGVHSPKFEHEADPKAVAAAVQRYAVQHPVLDDPALTTWDAYTAKAWPTLVLVDPLGYVVCQMSGEGHAAGLTATLERLVAQHDAAGTLHRGEGPYRPPELPSTALRFPGKLVALAGTFLVSDTAQHQLVELEADVVTERRRIGTGRRGLADGEPAAARFSEPQGLLLLPPEVAARVGYDVLVADTVNHALRGVRLADGRVGTVAGTGEQLRLRSGSGSGPAREQPLSSPWDLAWFDGRVVIAMAGVHQLWAFDPVAGQVEVLAGTSNEGLVDGPAGQAWFAQPSGLATDSTVAEIPDGAADSTVARTVDGTPDGTVHGAGEVLWVADAETSALRSVRLDPAGGYRVRTAIGQGLFDFGFRDGPAGQALLQHPLGVTVLPDGSVAIADTYNGAVRRYDPITGQVGTLARDLAEPSDLLVLPDQGQLLVVESAAHRVVRLSIPAGAQRVDGVARRTQRPATALAPGELTLRIAFAPPPGQQLDHSFGDPTRVEVSASPPELLLAGAGSGTGLVRTLRLAATPASGVLHLRAQAATCDADESAGAACHLYQQDWGVPITVDADGAAALTLHLLG
jgi:thiol-disulfide isomerase/thioredoxin